MVFQEPIEHLKHIECDSVSEAEEQYLKMTQEDCWVIHTPLKLVWSWKKLKTVCRFTMKRVDKKPMNIFDFSEKLSSCLSESIKTINTIMDVNRKRKIETIMRELNVNIKNERQETDSTIPIKNQ